ncbi:MAG: 6-phosphogluconolactonase, partial [Pseudomonadota bacterium]
MDFIEHEDRAIQAEALAVAVAGDIAEAIAAEGRAAIAVPGGSTPRPFLAALAAAPVDWSAVAVMATDERWAPPSDERSNEGMIRAAMAAAPIRFAPFWIEDETPHAAAKALTAQIAPLTPLTSVVIGMGADMHCASLFPGGDGLVEAMSPSCETLVLPMTAPGAPEPRVTLTLPALIGARRLRLMISGEEKKDALDRALEMR